MGNDSIDWDALFACHTRWYACSKRHEHRTIDAYRSYYKMTVLRDKLERERESLCAEPVSDDRAVGAADETDPFSVLSRQSRRTVRRKRLTYVDRCLEGISDDVEAFKVDDCADACTLRVLNAWGALFAASARTQSFVTYIDVDAASSETMWWLHKFGITRPSTVVLHRGVRVTDLSVRTVACACVLASVYDAMIYADAAIYAQRPVTVNTLVPMAVSVAGVCAFSRAIRVIHEKTHWTRRAYVRVQSRLSGPVQCMLYRLAR